MLLPLRFITCPYKKCYIHLILILLIEPYTLSNILNIYYDRIQKPILLAKICI